MSGARIATLVVDDHVMLAEGLASYLEHAPDIEVLGIATTGEAALASLEERPADVVLLDFRLPDTTGDEIARTIASRWQETKVVVITANDDDDVVARVIQVGCHGFLPKGRPAGEVLAAVRAVHAGEAVFDPAALARALPRLRRAVRSRQAGDDLTPREREVLQLLASGLTTAGIAERLVLSTATVRNHIQNVLTKLDAHSKLEAVTIALRHDIVQSR